VRVDSSSNCRSTPAVSLASTTRSRVHGREIPPSPPLEQFAEHSAFHPLRPARDRRREIAEVVDTLKSGWVTTGPKAKRFELVHRVPRRRSLESIAVNWPRPACHLALEAVGIGPATRSSRPRTPSRRRRGRALTSARREARRHRPGDALHSPRSDRGRYHGAHEVHRAGSTTRASRRTCGHLAIARKHGLKVVEDAAHALPTTVGGKLVGTLGAMPRSSALRQTRR